MRPLAALLASTALLASSPAALAAFGDIDPTFAAPAVPGGGHCYLQPLVLGDQGVLQVYRPAAAGMIGGAARLRTDGSRDPGWGNAGLVEWPLRTGEMAPIQVLRLADGGFLVVGAYAVRLRANGQLDTGYGTNGQSDSFSAVAQSGVQSAALMPDGGVAALLTEAEGAEVNYVVARLDANGRSLSRLRLPVNARTQRAYAWGVQADGRVQLASYPIGRDSGSLALVVNGIFQPQLHRYPDDFGAADQPFGLLPRDVSAAWIDRTVTADALGHVYLADACAGGACGGAALGVMRFDPAGAPDAGFGTGGLAVWFDGRGTASSNFIDRYVAHAMWPGPDGLLTIVLRHTSGGGRAIIFDYASRVIRLRDDGSFASTFPNDQQLGHADGSFAQLDDGRFLQADFMNASCGKLVRKLGDQPKGPATLVEYESQGRYFITAEGPEAAFLDGMAIGDGWKRTGRAFGAWLPAGSIAGAQQVCRFYGDLDAGPRTHFYSLQGPECDFVRASDLQSPRGTRAWRFEGLAFSAAPASASGACPANLQPVKRLYNDGFRRGVDSNHRFATDPSVVTEMQSRGWILEGVAFCASP